MFSIERQLSRVADDPTKKDQILMVEKLPGHMHNQSNRLSVTCAHQGTIRDRNFHKTEFINPKSTLNDQKLFRINPETQQHVGLPVTQKQSKLL